VEGSDEELLKVLPSWFPERCDELKPLWDARIRQVTKKPVNRGELSPEEFIAENAVADVARLDAELLAMQTRTGLIATAATLLFATVALNADLWGIAKAPVVVMVLTAAAFTVSLWPLTPPVRRAFKDAYEQRAHWTLLVTDCFSRWVLYTWLGDRRTPIITTYKKAHAIALLLLVAAAACMALGLGLGALTS